MGRAARSVNEAAAPLPADLEPPDRAGGPAAPIPPSGRLRPHPLFVTTDPDLLDDLLRIAARAGVTADVAPDPAGARPWVPLAGRVFVGADMAEPCARAGLPRRAGVVLVTRSQVSAGDRSLLETRGRFGWSDGAALGHGTAWRDGAVWGDGVGERAGSR